MLKNRAFQVKVVNDKKLRKATDESVEQSTSPEEIAEIAKDFVDHTTQTVQAAVVTTMLVATACKIAVIFVKAVTR
jgi:type I site-specific restriction-modification system R (restriction) subunit